MNSPSEQEPTEVLYSAIEDLLAERDALKDEREGLKEKLTVLTEHHLAVSNATAFAVDDRTLCIDLSKGNHFSVAVIESLRSQLAETQSNYQTLLDAVNHEIELRKAAEDQLAEAQEKLKATGIEAEVCGDITNRQQLGIAKYGQTVADNPAELGEWIQHAYEETLDNAVYLRRALQAIRSASQE